MASSFSRKEIMTSTEETAIACRAHRTFFQRMNSSEKCVPICLKMLQPSESESRLHRLDCAHTKSQKPQGKDVFKSNHASNNFLRNQDEHPHKVATIRRTKRPRPLLQQLHVFYPKSATLSMPCPSMRHKRSKSIEKLERCSPRV